MPNDFKGWDDPDYIDDGKPYTMERLPKLDGTMYDKLRRVRSVLPELIYMVNADLAPLPLLLLVQEYTYIIVTVDEGTTNIGNYYVDTAKLLGAGTQEITYSLSNNDKIHIDATTGVLSIDLVVSDDGKSFPVTVTGTTADGKFATKDIRVAIKVKVIEEVNTPPAIVLSPFNNGDMGVHHQLANTGGYVPEGTSNSAGPHSCYLKTNIMLTGEFDISCKQVPRGASSGAHSGMIFLTLENTADYVYREPRVRSGDNGFGVNLTTEATVTPGSVYNLAWGDAANLSENICGIRRGSDNVIEYYRKGINNGVEEVYVAASAADGNEHSGPLYLSLIAEGDTPMLFNEFKINGKVPTDVSNWTWDFAEDWDIKDIPLFIDPGAIASDLEDGDLTSEIVVTGDTVDPTVPGTYIITYTVTDSGGLTASVDREIIIDAPPEDEEITITYIPESVELNATGELSKEYSDYDGYNGTWLTRPLDVNEHRISSKIEPFEGSLDSQWMYKASIIEKWAIETTFPLESNVQDIISLVESRMAMPITTPMGDNFIVEEFVEPSAIGFGAPHIAELADGRTEIIWWISVNGGADYNRPLQGYLKVKTSDVKFTVMSSTRGDITDTAIVSRVADMPDDMDTMIWDAQSSFVPITTTFDLSQTVSAAKTDGTIISKTINFTYSYHSIGIN